MKRLVLDTSVIIKWFSSHGEDDLEKALRLRTLVLQGKCEITVPDLVLYEIANALRFNPRLDAGDVADAVVAVSDMGLDIRPVDPSLLALAADIAFRTKTTVYDSYFVALAQAEKVSFITADYKLYDRVKTLKHVVRLSDLT